MELQLHENFELNLSIETFINKHNVWFNAKSVCTILGYVDTNQAIRRHVCEEDKKTYPVKTTGQVRHTTFINESGLYTLIFSSRLETAKVFKRWVTNEVLPSIRKSGYYKNNTLKIENENDLHTKVVQYIRRFYPDILMVAGLGENQDSSYKRIESYKKGYVRGQPDLIINNQHKKYEGLCLEFKTPNGRGVLSEDQKNLLERYEDNGFKCMVSNDYDLIIRELISYCDGIRLKCKYCPKKFITRNTLKKTL